MTPAPRALHTGNCPTMPHPDPRHTTTAPRCLRSPNTVDADGNDLASGGRTSTERAGTRSHPGRRRRPGLALPRVLQAPFVPRLAVTGSRDSNHERNHTVAAARSPWMAPSLLDRPARRQSSQTGIAPHKKPGGPPRNLRFRGAMGVPPSHPPLGSLPVGFFRPGRVRARRRRPPVGSAAPPTRPASTPRERRARPPQTASSANASSARARQRQGCVAAAPPPAARGFGLDVGSGARSATGNCPTMPNLDPATHQPRRRGLVRRDSGAAQLVSCREGGSAFGLARKSESARSVVAVTEGRSGAEDLRSRLTAATDRALPDPGDRPVLIIRARPSGPATPLRRRVRNRRGDAPQCPSGVEGAEPPASPLCTQGVCWLMTYNGCREPAS